MISNLIRKALGPTFEDILKEERTRLNYVINALDDALDDVKSIRASDIADNISTYDIACDISLDAYDIAKNIDIDASDIDIDIRSLSERIAQDISIDVDDIDIDYAALARHIGGNIDIDASELDVQIDYTTLARNIADNIEVGVFTEEMRINNVHSNLQTVERKMDLILKHLGITEENA